MNLSMLKLGIYFLFTIINLGFCIYNFKNYTIELMNYPKIKENYYHNILFILIGFFSSFFLKLTFGKNLMNTIINLFSKNKSNYNYEYWGEKIYLFILYSFCIINFIYFGKGTYYIPKIFGGLENENMDYIEENIFYEIPNKGLLFMFCFMLGHHIFRNINHTLYGKSEVIFLTIHHHVTIYLMIFTLSTRYYLWGIKISFCHDFTDIFINWAKFLNELKKLKVFNFISIFLFFSSWLYFRDYLFNYKIYYQVFYLHFVSNKIKFQNIRDLISKSFLITFSVLTILVILNVIWTFKILKLIKNEFFRGNKIKNQ